MITAVACVKHNVRLAHSEGRQSVRNQSNASGDYLEELCTELELELQGTQSPAYRVTLPMRDRARVHIPMNAAFFTFIYPLTPWSSRMRHGRG